ncbi:hypothetical protein ACIQ9R_19265 [Streptomyces sp. NPDC094447]|uniref:hypothetical protein n=1 Tax=Streptomyces sp. NPDC094447 TaxID=3366062 RepID=UPI0037F85461
MPLPCPRTALVVVCLAISVTGAGTACGPSPGDRTTGTGTLSRAIEATESAISVTVHTDALSLSVPMKGHVSRDGRGNCTARMSYGEAGTAEVIRVAGRDSYLRRDEALLRMQERHRGPEELDALVSALRGRWTKPPAEGPDTPPELALCTGARVPSGLDNGWDDESAPAEPATVEGRKALRLAKPVGGEGETTTVYIAAEGPPYLLKIVTTGGETPGATTYAHYGRPVDAAAPAAEDVVDAVNAVNAD